MTFLGTSVTTPTPADDLEDPPEAQELRSRLVRELREDGDATSERTIAALAAVPRHLFVPHASLALARAYANRALPIGLGQTISQPAVVAIMTEALELTGDERVLEIGTGSGYQAAVLSMLAREVFSVERIDTLASAATARLARLGYRNVHVRTGDGYLGWPEEAPFDRVIVTAAAPELPKPLLEQLVDGGVLVAPVGSPHALFAQSLLRATKLGDRVVLANLGGVSFVEMLPGEQR